MSTNQIIQANNPNDTSSGPNPSKRKRGRPRKYPKLGGGESSRIPKLHRTRWQENRGPPPAPPPKFGASNGNPSRQPVAETPDPMVGRAVSGVIEAVFEAGYLLNVRVADSATSLRGVIFRPARIVPITPENDVAPNVPMIQRVDVNPPRSGNRRPIVQRGQFVPVVREPTRNSNGAAQVPNIGTKAAAAVLSNGTKSPPPAAAQFENLVTEVVKRIEAPSAENEDESDDSDQALEIEPISAVLVNDPDGLDNVEKVDKIEKVESAPVQIEVDQSSRMLQLLEVMQGPNSEPPVGPGLESKMAETESLVMTEDGDQEAGMVEVNVTQESLF